MKLESKRWYFTAALFLVLACSKSDRITDGGGTGIETTNGIVGKIESELGEPVSGVQVYLRSSHYVAEVNLGQAPEEALILLDTTDVNGQFEFTVEETGSYIIEAYVDDKKAVQIPVLKDKDTVIQLNVATVQQTGHLEGRIQLPENGLGYAYIQILGTDKFLDSVVGDFSLSNLPVGDYTLRTTGYFPFREPIETDVVIKENELTSGVLIVLAEADSSAEGTLSGWVLLPSGDSGTMGFFIEGFTNSWQFDSNSGKFNMNNIPPGEYQLKAWGSNPPRDTIRVAAVVTPGTATTNVNLVLGSELTGSISGTVSLPTGTSGSTSVYVLELDTLLNPSSGGNFSLTGIDKGSYMVIAWGVKPIRDTVIKMVDIDWGEHVSDMELSLKRSVLILEGIDIHNWKHLSNFYDTLLNRTGLFDIYHSVTPPFLSDTSLWDNWNPVFSDHDVVIFNFNNENDNIMPRWPREIEIAFENYLQNGGGLIVPHSAMSSFAARWDNFNQIIGLGWVGRNFNSHRGASVDSQGKLETIPKGSGTDPGSHPMDSGMVIHVVPNNHPINTGLPSKWMHMPDIPNINLRGYPENINLLSYAFVDNDSLAHPMEWTSKWGSGRIYVNYLGHDRTDRPDIQSVFSVGYQTNFIRAVEWAGTGQVTYSLPNNFPSESKWETNIIE